MPTSINTNKPISQDYPKHEKVPCALQFCLDPQISASTTLGEMLAAIQKYPEAVAAAAKEMERKSKDEERIRIRDWINQEMETSTAWSQPLTTQTSEETEMPQNKRRPGAIQLRVSVPCIARIQLDQISCCEVFSNGYAIYDNGDRKAVLWVPNCGAVTYYFCQLTESEKNYQKQYDRIDEDTMMNNPWYIPIVIAGEDQIERNMVHPKTGSGASDFNDGANYDEQTVVSWSGPSRFIDPETAYLRKEAWEEWFNKLSDSQRIVYDLYYAQGLTQQEIAKKLNVSQIAVLSMLKRMERKAHKIF